MKRPGSELRKGQRCDPRVRAWHSALGEEPVWLSALVIGEIRQGIEGLRRKDPVSAGHLETWLGGLLGDYADRILPVSQPSAQRWGRLNATHPVPYIDGYLAATAIEDALTLATRNVADIHRTGASYLNPFDFPSSEAK